MGVYARTKEGKDIYWLVKNTSGDYLDLNFDYPIFGPKGNADAFHDFREAMKYLNQFEDTYPEEAYGK